MKGRRDLIKMGVGAAVTALNARKALAQGLAPGPAVLTRTGWKNTARRSSGNGPMDNTTRQIVEYVSSFSEANLKPAVIEALGNTMVDSIASLIAGFESVTLIEPEAIAFAAHQIDGHANGEVTAHGGIE